MTAYACISDWTARSSSTARLRHPSVQLASKRSPTTIRPTSPSRSAATSAWSTLIAAPAAAGRAAKLAILRLDPKGGLTPHGTVATAAGARNAVATNEGVAYLTDAREGKILVVAPAASH